MNKVKRSRSTLKTPLEYYSKAAAQEYAVDIQARACLAAGKLLATAGDFNEALKFYKKAAAQSTSIFEQAEAALWLADQFYTRENVAPDFTQAMAYYRIAYTQGEDSLIAACQATNVDAYLSACLSLGDCFYRGHGVEQDYIQAYRFYIKADAALYNKKIALEARIRRAECSYAGSGVSQDYFFAVHHYKRVMENEVHSKIKGLAAFRLGECAFWGTGVMQNSSLARRYFAECLRFCPNSKLAHTAQQMIEKLDAGLPITLLTEINGLELLTDMQDSKIEMNEDEGALPCSHMCHLD